MKEDIGVISGRIKASENALNNAASNLAMDSATLLAEVLHLRRQVADLESKIRREMDDTQEFLIEEPTPPTPTKPRFPYSLRKKPDRCPLCNREPACKMDCR